MVLVGVCDESITEGTKLSSHVNKIGGHPIWLDDKCRQLPDCVNCGRGLVLITQLYCPLEGSPYHRSLYVFACKHRACWANNSSWRVYRCQKYDTSYTSSTSPAVTTETSSPSDMCWGEGADDWGDDSDDTDQLVAMVTGLSVTAAPDVAASQSDTKPLIDESCANTDDCGLMKQSPEFSVPGDASPTAAAEISADQSPEICVPEDIVLPQDSSLFSVINVTAQTETETKTETKSEVLLGFYLNVFEEPNEESRHFKHENELLKQYQAKEGVDVQELLDRQKNAKGSAEGYEKVKAPHGDSTFHKFQKRLQRCPEQVIRYDYGGTPLPIQATTHQIPACPSCRKPQTFEVQLMPAMVTCLLVQPKAEPAVEFGTVLAYTCSENCWEDDASDWREESVIVYPDPDHELFR